MKRKLAFYALLIVVSTAPYVSATTCWLCGFLHISCIGDTPPVFDYCIDYGPATGGLRNCYPKGTIGWWMCSECPSASKAHCSDYEIEYVCTKDPCEAIPGGGGCNWSSSGSYCHAGCGGKPEAKCRNESCLPDYDKSGSFYRCLDCPVSFACSKYKTAADCSANPCKVAGACMWWGSSCVEDADKDGCPDRYDNCPSVPNMDPGSRIMSNRYCDSSTKCDREGDACDDTDGDGLLDEYEKTTAGMDPLNTDANENCIPDGVEYAFDPLIKVLSGIAVAIAACMLAYVAVGWLTSDTPAKRDNAKRAVIYIVAGLLLLAGGKDLVIFLLQDTCPKPPNVGYSCSCDSTCPTAPEPQEESSPFIYSYDGVSFYLEHDGYPMAVLPPWEYETYGRLSHIREADGYYRVRLAEELSYTAYANRLRLLAADHPKGTEAYPDIQGGVHTIADPVKPISCLEEDGTDCIEFMEDDGVYWRSSADDKNLSDSDGDGVVDVYNPEDLYDGIILSFPNPEKSRQAKLLLKVKDSGAIAAAWHSFLDEIGRGGFEALVRYSAKKPVYDALSALRGREAYCNVRVWGGETWVLAETFGVGPSVPAEFIIPLSVPAEDTIKIKIDSAVLAYEIDYAVIDYSEDADIKVTELSPYKAESRSKAGDDEAKLSVYGDDKRYLPLARGEHVDYYFKAPPEGGGERTVIAGIKGYYLSNLTKETQYRLKSAETVARFIFEPTYAIRYAYPKYLRREEA
jgi:hypothetical protein